MGGHIWAVIYGRSYLGDHIWVAIFGQSYLGGHIWVAVFGQPYLASQVCNKFHTCSNQILGLIAIDDD